MQSSLHKRLRQNPANRESFSGSVREDLLARSGRIRIPQECPQALALLLEDDVRLLLKIWFTNYGGAGQEAAFLTRRGRGSPFWQSTST